MIAEKLVENREDIAVFATEAQNSGIYSPDEVVALVEYREYMLQRSEIEKQKSRLEAQFPRLNLKAQSKYILRSGGQRSE